MVVLDCYIQKNFTSVKIVVDDVYSCREDVRLIHFMTKKRPELTVAEWSIIKAVWESEPCTAPAIQLQLEKETRWTYSTVRTLMDRMVGKGLLAADRARSVTVYRSAITRAQAQRNELLYALKHAFNGALTPMVQCLLDSENLTPKDLAEIEVLIKTKRKGAKK